MASKKVNINLPNLNDLNIEIHLEGNWDRAVNQVTGLRESISLGYEAGIEKFSRSLLRIVKSSIRTGKPPKNSGVYWEPLSTKTIKRYGEHSIYYMTGQYYRSVGLFKYKNRTYVGIQTNKKRSSSGGLTLNQLGILLEYGSRNNSEGFGYIPPRPIWGPSFISLGGLKKLKEILLRSIRSRLRSDLRIMPNQVR